VAVRFRRMRVLVTGATGFVGAWTARAIGDAGHAVRLLVRDPARLPGSAAAIGVDTTDVVEGDITDAGSVAAALDGCDAVVHCAAVVATTDRRRSHETRGTNLTGARNVLGAAAELGLDPIVHVSSITALFRPGLERLHADLPVAGGDDVYGRSKAEVDVYARRLQDDGAPVVLTYPGMVLGPPAGSQFGEVGAAVETLLRKAVVPGRDAAWTVVDVRDLAAAHAALLTPGRGPRRYLCGGHHLRTPELVAVLREVTGRPIKLIPLPGAALRGMGRMADIAGRLFKFDGVITAAGMRYYTQMPPSDDGPSERELGIGYRPPSETFAAAIAGLADVGRLSAVEAGMAAVRA